MIFKQWQEDHEKSAFSSVYNFMFSSNAADNSPPDDGQDAGNVTVTVPLPSPSAVPVANSNEESCQGIEEPKTTTTTTLVNEDGGAVKQQKLKLSVVSEEDNCNDGQAMNDDLERTDHEQFLKCKKPPRGKNINAPKPSSPRLADAGSHVISDAISPKHDQPAVIVAVERKRKVMAGNKVITPAIELRIDEEVEEEEEEDVLISDSLLRIEEVVGALTTTAAIKPVGAAADDRGGGLRKSVDAECEIDAEIAIFRAHDDDAGEKWAAQEDYNNNSVIRDDYDDEASKRLLINVIATNADVHPEPSTATTVISAVVDNHKAAPAGSSSEAASKESTSSHHEIRDGAKVIVAKGERESLLQLIAEGVGGEKPPPNDAVKSTNSTKVVVGCDNKNKTADRSGGEGEKEQQSCIKPSTATKGDRNGNCAATPPTLIANRMVMERESDRGVGGERRNLNVQIRRKQYDLICSFDDYITATSSSSLDDLDTLSLFDDDDYGEQVGAGGGGISVESGSERMSKVEVGDAEEAESTISREDVKRTAVWIKEVLDEQQGRDNDEGVVSCIVTRIREVG